MKLNVSPSVFPRDPLSGFVRCLCVKRGAQLLLTALILLSLCYSTLRSVNQSFAVFSQYCSRLSTPAKLIEKLFVLGTVLKRINRQTLLTMGRTL